MVSKNKKCIICGREDLPWFSKRRCIWCAQRSYSKKASTSTKKKKKITGASKTSLEAFFAFHIEEILKKPVCDNCGGKLFGIKGECAHVLGKRESRNPEIASNLENCLYLCMWGNSCHANYDNRQDGSSSYKLKCWTLAVEKYKKLKPFITNSNPSTRNFDKYIEEHEQS